MSIRLGSDPFHFPAKPRPVRTGRRMRFRPSTLYAAGALVVILSSVSLGRQPVKVAPEPAPVAPVMRAAAPVAPVATPEPTAKPKPKPKHKMTKAQRAKAQRVKAWKAKRAAERARYFIVGG